MASERAPQPDELQTVKALAEAYEMGESTVWLLIRRHDLPRYRMPGQGKKTFIHRDDFDRAYRTPVPVRRAEEGKAAA